MTMLTKWGAALDRSCPLPEYPRPQLRRESFYNLNGVWDYAITASMVETKKKLMRESFPLPRIKGGEKEHG